MDDMSRQLNDRDDTVAAERAVIHEDCEAAEVGEAAQPSDMNDVDVPMGAVVIGEVQGKRSKRRRASGVVGCCHHPDSVRCVNDCTQGAEATSSPQSLGAAKLQKRKELIATVRLKAKTRELEER